MFLISEDQVKAVIAYAAAKPFIEVHELIRMLSNLPKQEEKDTE